MKKIIELNNDKTSVVLKAETSASIPKIEGEGKYQAVIVHADCHITENMVKGLSMLLKMVDPDRLIEARFFNDEEEHRILRVIQNGAIRFMYRHIRDGMNSEKATYDKSVDTSADYYKCGYTLSIRNYISKRGLLYSYDDLRFVKLENK